MWLLKCLDFKKKEKIENTYLLTRIVARRYAGISTRPDKAKFR
jgi:hypothetical protein